MTHPFAHPRNKSSFQDRNGVQVKAGNRVIYVIDGRKGVIDEALRDGDAFVTFDLGDDGQYATVKWRHLVKEMTPYQRSALEFLADNGLSTPSAIGVSWNGGIKKNGEALKQQGAGRIGALMAKRLIALGWVHDLSFRRRGFPLYGISRAGLRQIGRSVEADRLDRKDAQTLADAGKEGT